MSEEAGVLHVVPTPIGNDADVSRRAVAVLEAADLVAAEDTRTAQTFLGGLGLKKHVISCFDHNEGARAPRLVEDIRGGRKVALISEAGTPVLNDPGYRVVRAVLDAGLPVVVLPGPCAAITALVASGLPPARFLFGGFLPRAQGERRRAIEEVARLPFTLVFYESPHRVAESVNDLREVLGDRQASLAFEMTKPREKHQRGKLSEIGAALAAEDTWMGEITLVVEGAPEGADAAWDRAEVLMKALLDQDVEPRVVRDAVVATFDLPKRAVYQRVLALANPDPHRDR